MNTITQIDLIKKYRSLAAEMMQSEEYKEDDFDSEWIRSHAWKVVPVEDENHFSDETIAAIISGLVNLGFRRCVALATEPLGDLPSCYDLSLTLDDFREFNKECGAFRFLLFEETRLWAISCNEWYNLFAGEKTLVEKFLRKSIEEARKEFLIFAGAAGSGDPEYPLLKAARHYASF